MNPLPVLLRPAVMLTLCTPAAGQQFYGIAFNRNLYRYDAATGTAAPLKNLSAVGAPNSMTSFGGSLYVGSATRVVELSAPLWNPVTVFNFTPPGTDSIRSLAAHPVTGDIYSTSLQIQVAKCAARAIRCRASGGG